MAATTPPLLNDHCQVNNVADAIRRPPSLSLSRPFVFCCPLVLTQTARPFTCLKTFVYPLRTKIKHLAERG